MCMVANKWDISDRDITCYKVLRKRWFWWVTPCIGKLVRRKAVRGREGTCGSYIIRSLISEKSCEQ